ncbi:MAG: hypothetical protein WCU80_08250 [Paludibacteraceae bacterium]|nr:hypothetical protein [Prevotellaceae bacterium]
MRKPTLLVPILFVYSAGMAIWGYVKGTIDGKEALLFMGLMCVMLVILWFLYRKKEKYRIERDRMQEEEERKKWLEKKNRE